MQHQMKFEFLDMVYRKVVTERKLSVWVGGWALL
jgi:hypothetical protein